MRRTGRHAPKLIAVVVLTMACFAANPLWAADPARLPDGFRGALWGARVETLPGMVAVDAEGDVVHYDREGDKKTLGPIAVKLIDYSFYKDQFYHAAILYERGFDVVQETLEAKYGKPDGTKRKTDADGRDYTVTEWLWPGQVYIGHRRFVDEDGGRIFYFYAPLADQALGRQAAPKKAAGTGGEYLVKKGETLSLIAARLGVSVDALRAANGNLDPRKLKAGQTLVIPSEKAAKMVGDDSAAPAAPIAEKAPESATELATEQPKEQAKEQASAPGAAEAGPKEEAAAVAKDEAAPVEPAPSTAAESAESAGTGRYEVRPGDSPARIAARLGLSTETLMRANKGLDPKKLRPGQILVVPEGKSVNKTPESAPQETSPASVAPAKDAAEKSSGEADAVFREHVIKPGDLIKDLARRYGVSEKDILTANGIKDPRRLQIGQVLKIPPAKAP